MAKSIYKEKILEKMRILNEELRMLQELLKSASSEEAESEEEK